MTKIVVVNKNGDLETTTVKNISKDILYKKCGFRKSEGFSCRTTWKVSLKDDKYSIELWAKENGTANTENKYDFPPPCDSSLYFGKCCVVRVDNEDANAIQDLEGDTWQKIYEKLFGGFEDLVSESESEDELEDVPSDMKTKDGYLKDGFVVDSHSDKSDGKTTSSSEGDYESEEGDSMGSESDDDSEDSELQEEMYSYTSDEN